MTGLTVVPERVVAELTAARLGVLVLGIDGLAYRPALRAWESAEVTRLTSTVPSTSATAWLTALTGASPAEHGVPGMVYRVAGALVYAVTGEVIAGTPGPQPLVRPVRNLFERAGFERAALEGGGARCLTIGRELANLPGPWARTLLRGASPACAPMPAAELARQAGDPGLLVDAVTAQVSAVLGGLGGAGALLWVYVNLDDYVHANGYDAAVRSALRRLDRAALRWAAGGWTVLAHSDHGQVPVRPDPALALAWQGIDNPRDCELPGGGAGRIRWLYPRPGRVEPVRQRLIEALGDVATVTGPAELGLPADRTGPVVAVANSDRFPLPDPTLRFEHGGLDRDELDVPLAVWRPG